jgi:tRNA A37 threonylcarbamoyltransferase TsaD
MKKKRHRKKMIRLMQSIDDKLGEIIDGQARLEALMEPGQSALKPEASRPIRQAA